MDDILKYLVSGQAWWVWLLAIGVVAAIVYIRHDSFLITDFSYRFPVIGKLARFSKDYSETSRGGWLNVEASLCHDYSRHVSALSPEEFERNCEYLRKAYDHGRKPMPLGIMALLALLVILEALGFSYLLSSWMALESSENERQLLTVAIVLVLASVLVWVTHNAGHQLYRTSLLRSCFQQFQAELIQPDDGSIPDERRSPRVYSSGIVSLREEQRIDSHMPTYVQCANRVAARPDDLGSYAWVWVAALLILSVAAISTILRIETLHSNDAAPNLIGALFNGGTPAQSDPNAASAREYAAVSSFGLLSVIFVVTQLVGMGVGYRYGFAGKQSDEAYRATRGCADYKTYFYPVLKRMRIANYRLTTLHRLMERRLPHEIHWKYDFFAYIRQEREAGSTDLQDPAELQPPKAEEEASYGSNGSRPAPAAALSAKAPASRERRASTSGPAPR